MKIEKLTQQKQMIDKKSKYLFTFDLDTEKLKKFTGSKTKPYNEIKKFLTEELKFKHEKDCDYSTSMISMIDYAIKVGVVRLNICFLKYQSLKRRLRTTLSNHSFNFAR
jgi:virulence-associated protein VapD